MSHLSQQILQTVEELPTEDQRQVLDFVKFIWTKRQQSQLAETKVIPRSLLLQETGHELSFFEVAQDLIGAGEGPGDLSTNPDYLQGYGQ
jgi:hypothetical protein